MHNSSTMIVIVFFFCHQLVAKCPVDPGDPDLGGIGDRRRCANSSGKPEPMQNDPRTEGRATIQEEERDVLQHVSHFFSKWRVFFFWFFAYSFSTHPVFFFWWLTGFVVAMSFFITLSTLALQYKGTWEMIEYHPFLGRVCALFGTLGFVVASLLTWLVFLVFFPCIVLSFLLWTWKTKRPRDFTLC